MLEQQITTQYINSNEPFSKRTSLHPAFLRFVLNIAQGQFNTLQPEQQNGTESTIYDKLSNPDNEFRILKDKEARLDLVMVALDDVWKGVNQNLIGDRDINALSQGGELIASETVHDISNNLMQQGFEADGPDFDSRLNELVNARIATEVVSAIAQNYPELPQIEYSEALQNTLIVEPDQEKPEIDNVENNASAYRNLSLGIARTIQSMMRFIAEDAVFRATCNKPLSELRKRDIPEHLLNLNAEVRQEFMIQTLELKRTLGSDMNVLRFIDQLINPATYQTQTEIFNQIIGSEEGIILTSNDLQNEFLARSTQAHKMNILRSGFIGEAVGALFAEDVLKPQRYELLTDTSELGIKLSELEDRGCDMVWGKRNEQGEIIDIQLIQTKASTTKYPTPELQPAVDAIAHMGPREKKSVKKIMVLAENLRRKGLNANAQVLTVNSNPQSLLADMVKSNVKNLYTP